MPFAGLVPYSIRTIAQGALEISHRRLPVPVFPCSGQARKFNFAKELLDKRSRDDAVKKLESLLKPLPEMMRILRAVSYCSRSASNENHSAQA